MFLLVTAHPGCPGQWAVKRVVVVVVFGGCTHFDTWDWWTAELVGGTNNYGRPM